jgi:hypothetical protein
MQLLPTVEEIPMLLAYLIVAIFCLAVTIAMHDRYKYQRTDRRYKSE